MRSKICNAARYSTLGYEIFRPVDRAGIGTSANYESDFLSLSGIPANQCRGYSRTACSTLSSLSFSLPATGSLPFGAVVFI